MTIKLTPDVQQEFSVRPTWPNTVFEGNDSEALNTLIQIHCRTSFPEILDCTFNKGVMWKKCSYQPTVKNDISSLYAVDVCSDFHFLPFHSGSFDVVVFDPPHLPDVMYNDKPNSKNAGYHIKKTYGLGILRGDNINHLFLPFLIEAERILKNNGVLLAKICDLIHNHKYQWQMVSFVNAAFEAGLRPDDLIIKKNSSGKLIDPRWENVYHFRKNHSYWVVSKKKGKKL